MKQPQLKLKAANGARYMLFIFFIACTSIIQLSAQDVVSGTIYDDDLGEGLVGAQIIVKGTPAGAYSESDGSFVVQSPKSVPFTLEITYIGYDTLIYEVTSTDKELKLRIKPQAVSMGEVEIVASASQERQRQSPLSLESMSINAIKETPASNFYEGLGHLKGVDMTQASIGLKVINTRGFASATPVRSLQVIDGVDNQSPGLNFSLGNFLGASELDIETVDLVVGAASAFYGPNAFNGVISMTTKNPFIHTGLTVQAQAGERKKGEIALRYAKAIGKEGKEKLAFKLNGYYLRVRDWEAENFNSIFNSTIGTDNPGGYDAVSRYGDEQEFDALSPSGKVLSPGLGAYHRTGYVESALIDYDTRNYKASAALHYKITPKIEAIAAFNTAGGTLVMQGQNRLSLKNISFFQSRLEIRQKNKFFVRAYKTWEDAGDSYDAFFTANRLQESVHSNSAWQKDYINYWQQGDRINGTESVVERVKRLEAYPGPPTVGNPFNFARADSVLALPASIDSLTRWHAEARAFTDLKGLGRLKPGTPAYDSVLQSITAKPLVEGGTRLVDRSALYHLHGEYIITPSWMDKITVGANARIYAPETDGNIFKDGLDPNSTDSSYLKITNSEFGAYLGIAKKLLNKRLKVHATLRVDKNQNFDPIPTFLASGVYNLNNKDVLRVSISTAIRNPTLSDQYLNFKTGRNITLIGNLAGFPHLADTASFNNYRRTSPTDSSLINYFDVGPIRPEKVRTFEIGYRSIIADKVYLDASYYYSRYTDFIGYNLGLTFAFESGPFSNPNNVLPSTIEVWRVSANAKEVVTSQGFSLGLDYFLSKGYTVGANYSWNKLNTKSDDPIIPAFNTPEHKYNIKFTGRDVKWGKLRNMGFSINYKWMQGYLFEGSPNFTGNIPAYTMLDIQINKKIPSIKTTFKLGASNILNNRVYQIYGGPLIGRLAYFTVTTHIN